MPTEMLTKRERRFSPAAVPIEDEELRAATKRQSKRVRRLKINATAWGLGTILLTATWVVHEWQANGAFERIAHEGNTGDWNPTLWALAVLIWGLVVGIMALRVYFERPVPESEVDRAIARLEPHARADAELRRRVRAWLERLAQLRFHAAAWLLGMIVLTPLNALIEWQDNGGFQRFSHDSQPGSWDPWILYVGGIWALAIFVFYALPAYLDRRKMQAEDGGDGRRLTPSS